MLGRIAHDCKQYERDFRFRAIIGMMPADDGSEKDHERPRSLELVCKHAVRCFVATGIVLVENILNTTRQPVGDDSNWRFLEFLERSSD